MTREQLEAHGQRTYAAYEVRPLRDLGSPKEIASVWRPLAQHKARSEDVGDLLEYIGEFVWHRYMQPSAKVYRQWRQEGGYRLRDPEFLRKTMYVGPDYEAVFGAPYPGNQHIVEVFDRFWSAGLTFRDGSARIVGIASDRPLIDIAFGSLSEADPNSWPMLDGALGRDLWYGRAQGTMRNWWTPEGESRAEALRRHGTLEAAVVGIVMEYQTGDRRPTVYGFWRAPGGPWRHEWITNNNAGLSLSATEY